MIYYYMLDDNNRITSMELTPRYPEYINNIIDIPDISLINIGLDGIIDGKIVYIGRTRGEIIDFTLAQANANLGDLKLRLQETDYKVLKNFELYSVGLQYEYDPMTLHLERQKLRNEINTLIQLITDTSE